MEKSDNKKIAVLNNIKNQQSLLFYLKIIRVAVIASLLLITAIIQLFFQSEHSLAPVIYVLLIFLLVSISFFFSEKYFSLRLNIYLQLLFDVFVITTLVYFSGGTVSPFYFLYLLPIILSSFFLGRKGAVYLSSCAFIAFGILSDLLFLKILRIFPENDFLEISKAEFIYNLIMAFIAFVGTAVFASNYFERLTRTKNELNVLRNDYQDLLFLNNAVLENMESGFLTADLEGVILSLNSRLQKSLNLKIGDNFFDTVLSEQERDHLQRVLHYKNSFYLEKELQGYFWGINISRLLKIREYKPLFVVLLNDLTAFRNIEKKLIEKEKLAMLGEMAAGLAHEIRNPLTSISGSIQFLKKELQLNEQQARLMDIVINESQRLSASIEFFVNFSREFKVNRIRVNLAEILESQIYLLQVKYPQIMFKKMFNQELFIFADQNLLNQLVRNILENCCKAVSDLGLVEVIVVEEKSKLRLIIRDNGIGMDTEELNQVFTPFFSKFSRGFGIGMSVVKRIAEAHKMKISIRSQKNRGTEVEIEIPLEDEINKSGS